MPDRPVSLVLALDDLLLRDALSRAAEGVDDIEVIACVGSCVGALDVLNDIEAPDVVVLAPQHCNSIACDVLAALRERSHTSKTLILAHRAEAERAMGTLRQGVDGFLLTDISVDDFFAAVRTAHSGGLPLAPVIVPQLVQELRRVPAPSETSREWEELSARECEVVQMAASGLTNRSIARRLSITEGTVKNHVHAALGKLNVPSRAAAAEYLRARNLLAEP